MAPKIHKDEAYGQMADVFSLGCLAYELMTLRPAYAGASQTHIALNIVNGPVPTFPRPWAQTLLAALVWCMLQKEPQDRPTMAKVERSVDAMSSRW